MVNKKATSIIDSGRGRLDRRTAMIRAVHGSPGPAILILFATGMIATAHHNMSATFDVTDRVTVTGTLTAIDWRNPHIELVVEFESAQGQAETWRYEGPPPAFFARGIAGKAEFQAAIGKQVTVEASRARDGSHLGLLRRVTLPDNKVVSACQGNC
jgi:hypothetical protein